MESNLAENQSAPIQTAEVQNTKAGNNKILLAVIAFLVLLLILVTGFFMFKDQDDNANDNDNGTEEEQTSDTDEEDEDNVEEDDDEANNEDDQTEDNGGDTGADNPTTATTVNFSEIITEKAISGREVRITGSYSKGSAEEGIKLTNSQDHSPYLSLKSGGIELTFWLGYEVEEYINYDQYTEVKDAKITNLGRYYRAAEGKWIYVNDKSGTTCANSISDDAKAPCGYGVIGKPQEYLLHVQCFGDVNYCDQIMKTVAVTKIK